MIGLIKAVRDFDVTQKTSFSSFAELCVSRQMYSAIEASNRKKASAFEFLCFVIDGCVLIALFTFGMIHVTSIILAIVARSLPDAMDNYQNLIENSGLTEYSLMWVFSTLILPPLVEEMIFRGLIQKYLERAGMHWIWRMLYRRFCLECSIKISYREFMRHFWGLHLDLWRIATTPGGIHADAYVL